MKRRIAVIASVSVGLLLSVATLAILWCHYDVSKLTASFVNAETCTGPFPNFDMNERLAFAVQNDGKTPVPFVVSEIKDEHGNWIKSFHKLDDADAGRTTHLYLYVPKGSHPQAVRLCGYKKANMAEKAQFSLKVINDKIRGRFTPGNKVWFEQLSVPAYEFVVKIETKAELGGGTNKSQALAFGTNLTSVVADPSGLDRQVDEIDPER